MLILAPVALTWHVALVSPTAATAPSAVLQLGVVPLHGSMVFDPQVHLLLALSQILLSGVVQAAIVPQLH